MSWLCYIPPGIEIAADKLKNAWDKNSDGGGFSYVKDEKIITHKGFNNFEDFIKVYNNESNLIDFPRLILFRNAYTNRNEENCQPITINENVVFAHCGFLAGFASAPQKSDSILFNENILQPFLQNDFKKVYSPEIQWIIAESIGYSSLVFLTKDGKASILNAHRGEWSKEHADLWFNNKDHEYPKVASSYQAPYYNQNSQTWTPKSKTEPEPYLTWLRKCYFAAKEQLKNEQEFAGQG